MGRYWGRTAAGRQHWRRSGNGLRTLRTRSSVDADAATNLWDVKVEMESQKGESTPAIQPAKNWMHEAPATGQCVRLWQIYDSGSQVTEPWHDLRAAIGGVIESTDVSDVWIPARLKLRDERKHCLMDPVDMIDRHVRGPTAHHWCDPWRRGYRAATN